MKPFIAVLYTSITGVLLVTGCSTTATSARNEAVNSVATTRNSTLPGDTTTSNTSTTSTPVPSYLVPPPNAGSGQSTSSSQQGSSLGWRYVEFPKSLGYRPQLSGVQSIHGQMQLVVITERTAEGTTQDQYSASTYQPQTNLLSSNKISVDAPKSYVGPWKLSFGQMNGHHPVSMTLVGKKTSVTIPSSIPAYASEINPPMGDPGSFDNQILGQTGDWVWIAMKGPGDPPIPQLVWGYRQWNRILAVNTQTKQTCVFSIPRGTSPVYSWGVTPGFGVIGNTVYVGTGNWLGAFPANPTNESFVPVLVPEPASDVAADETAMLQTLTDMESQAATGITNFWNEYVMNGDQNATNNTWIGNPAIYNHGDYPTELYWALNFPLKPGSQAYKTRVDLVSEIQQLIRSPLVMAWIVYPDPALMKSHFDSKPPTAVPGYKTVNGYYVKG